MCLTTNAGSVCSSCATFPVSVSSHFSSTASAVLVLVGRIIARERVIVVRIEVIAGHGVLRREREGREERGGGEEREEGRGEGGRGREEGKEERGREEGGKCRGCRREREREGKGEGKRGREEREREEKTLY